MREVRGLAGAEILVAVVVGNGRGPQVVAELTASTVVAVPTKTSPSVPPGWLALKATTTSSQSPPACARSRLKQNVGVKFELDPAPAEW